MDRWRGKEREVEKRGGGQAKTDWREGQDNLERIRRGEKGGE